MAKIILLGYMGSGKTQTAKALSLETGLPMIDLDARIEAQAGQSVTEIFQNEGEIRFRKREHDLLAQLMQTNDSFILALGGGTPCYANNHRWLNGDGIASVYLKTSIDQLHHRLSSEKAHRPLIAQMDDGQMKEFIAKSLFERSYYYNQATHTVQTDGRSPNETAREIAALL